MSDYFIKLSNICANFFKTRKRMNVRKQKERNEFNFMFLFYDQ